MAFSALVENNFCIYQEFLFEKNKNSHREFKFVSSQNFMLIINNIIVIIV